MTTKTTKHTIKIDSSRGQPRVLRGASYLFRSPLAARSMSRSCTTNPGVEIFIAADGVELYAARGDNWIGNGGERGTWLYGRGGASLLVVESAR